MGREGEGRITNGLERIRLICCVYVDGGIDP